MLPPSCVLSSLLLLLLLLLLLPLLPHLFNVCHEAPPFLRLVVEEAHRSVDAVAVLARIHQRAADGELEDAPLPSAQCDRGVVVAPRRRMMLMRG